jgi:hypothetical protein
MLFENHEGGAQLRARGGKVRNRRTVVIRDPGDEDVLSGHRQIGEAGALMCPQTKSNRSLFCVA